MTSEAALKALEDTRTATQFSSGNQPSSEAKKQGWERAKARKTIKGALIAELAHEYFDTSNNSVYSEAELFARDLIQEWKKSKDPRLAKLILDFSDSKEVDPEERVEQITIKIGDTVVSR